MKYHIYLFVFMILLSCQASRSLPHYETWTIKRIYENGMITVKHIKGHFIVERPDTLRVGGQIKVAINYKDSLKGNIKYFPPLHHWEKSKQ